MILNRTQKLAIAKRVEHHFDAAESWFQNGWGRKFNGMSVILANDKALIPKMKNCKCLCLTGAVHIAGAELLGCRPADFRGETSESILRHYVIAGNMVDDTTESDEPYHNAVMRWNDAPDRSFGEVQDIAKHVVKALEAQAPTQRTSTANGE